MGRSILLHCWERHTALTLNTNDANWWKMHQLNKIQQQKVCRWSTRNVSLHFQRIWDKTAPQIVQWWDIPREEDVSEWRRSHLDYWELIASNNICSHLIPKHFRRLLEPCVNPTLCLQAPIFATLLRNEWTSLLKPKFEIFGNKMCVKQRSPNGENMMRKFLPSRPSLASLYSPTPVQSNSFLKVGYSLENIFNIVVF
jgi:hypothetical protein